MEETDCRAFLKRSQCLRPFVEGSCVLFGSELKQLALDAQGQPHPRRALLRGGHFRQQSIHWPWRVFSTGQLSSIVNRRQHNLHCDALEALVSSKLPCPSDIPNPLSKEESWKPRLPLISYLSQIPSTCISPAISNPSSDLSAREEAQTAAI
jgi:hypothetical protein